MTFDKIYYTEKKEKLIKKAQQIQSEYINNAFKFTNEIKDIETELQSINEWEKENPEVKTEETK